jgi:hypothetical protein
MKTTNNIMDEVLDSLELKGIVEKNGEFRTAPNGEVQPIWVMTPLGKRLSEANLLDNYLSTWKADLNS